ncbi:MAG: serine--tRNA ligase [Bacteroidales bacterium]|nr:serine--tRNA ligase [Bacteroidales bacterium]
MLTLAQIKKDKEDILLKLKIKNFDGTKIIKKVIKADDMRRNLQQEADSKQAELKSISKKIGELMKQRKANEANIAREETSQLKNKIKSLQGKQADTFKIIKDLLVQVPNIPHESVPDGKSEQDNVLIRKGGRKHKLPENPLPHWELGKKYDIIDFELGNKITGAGFPVYKGKGARLQRALINFFLDENEKAGYREILPPLMVNEDSGFGTGQLPDKEGQMYYVKADNLYLIPTAEVPVTNIYRNVILDEGDLPVKNTAYTPCFRREAGSYGKDVRGLNRLHQFDKVEIVQIQHPGKSYQSLDEMVDHVEGIIKKLSGLPYRIVKLCGGDLGFTSALTYDFEVYSAAQEKWLEVSSVSNFESYQSNRLQLRYKDMNLKNNQHPHTLNGSALALPRIVAALLENRQTADGITIPKSLWRYTGFKIIN